jgi:hypothetical protein
MNAVGPRLNGILLWAKLIADVGVLGYLVIFLLGGIPGLPSPIQRRDAQIDQLQAIILSQQETIRLRDIALRELNLNILNLVRKVCRGSWRGNEQEQAACAEWVQVSPPAGPAR